MKKYFYLSAAALATLFATSCSSDDVPAPVDGDLTTFQVQLPDQLVTRFGEGQKATKLYVAIYDQGTKTVRFSNFPGEGNTLNAESLDISEFSKGEKPTCTVSVPLVKGKQYDLIFFAQDPTSTAYSFSTADQTMSVSYTDMANFQEPRDAFFGQITEFTSEGKGGSVTLTRPFAQVNIGTLDYDKYKLAAGVNSQTFGMKVSGIANTINLLDGTVEPADADNSATTTLLAPTPDDTYLVVNTKQYDYLAMGYFLVGSTATTQATLNVDLYVGDTNKSFANYPSVPAQMNFRTNIFGDLLTNSENFQVVIDADFNINDNNHEVKNIAAGDGQGLKEALEDPNVGEINVTGDVDLSDLFGTRAASDEGEEIVLPGAKVINVAKGVTVKFGPKQCIETHYPLTLKGGGTLTNETNEDLGAGVDASLVRIWNADLVIDGLTMINNRNHHYHPAKDYNSSAISYWGTGNVTIKNAKIYSGMFALCGMGRGYTNTAKVLLENSYFESTSHSSYGTNNWAYCLRIFGSEGVMRNCEVKGIQGAISLEEITLTIESGLYYTYKPEGKGTPFYALHASNKGTAIVNGGYFFGGQCHSTLAEGNSSIVCGDNDTGQPFGYIILNGGYTNGKAYNYESGESYQPAGNKVYKEVNAEYKGMTFKYQIADPE